MIRIVLPIAISESDATLPLKRSQDLISTDQYVSPNICCSQMYWSAKIKKQNRNQCITFDICSIIGRQERRLDCTNFRSHFFILKSAQFTASRGLKFAGLSYIDLKLSQHSHCWKEFGCLDALLSCVCYRYGCGQPVNVAGFELE